MEDYTNDKGEIVVIADMDNPHLIHSIAKQAEAGGRRSDIVTALKAEAIKRLYEAKEAKSEDTNEA